MLDPTIMNAVNVFEGVKENGVLVLNTTHKTEELNLPKEISKVAVLDATKIALDLIGRPITNTVMLGAFCKATGSGIGRRSGQESRRTMGGEE